MSGRPVRSVAWRRHDAPFTEVCRLRRPDRSGWTVEGAAVGAWDGTPFALGYAVRCDARFRTLDATVSDLSAPGGSRPVVALVRAPDGTWTSSGARAAADAALEAVAGCVDVDFGFSPSTNTLPIRRLSLDVGEHADVDAAWVRFPELTLERLAQRYTRLAERRYRYESRDGGFQADLEVDDDGLS